MSAADVEMLPVGISLVLIVAAMSEHDTVFVLSAFEALPVSVDLIWRAFELASLRLPLEDSRRMTV